MMLYDDTLKLISEARTQDARGQLSVTETESDSLLCEVKSISRMEWDGAQQRGYDAEICLIIFFGSSFTVMLAALTSLNFIIEFITNILLAPGLLVVIRNAEKNS